MDCVVGGEERNALKGFGNRDTIGEDKQNLEEEDGKEGRETG